MVSHRLLYTSTATITKATAPAAPPAIPTIRGMLIPPPAATSGIGVAVSGPKYFSGETTSEARARKLTMYSGPTDVAMADSICKATETGSRLPTLISIVTMVVASAVPGRPESRLSCWIGTAAKSEKADKNSLPVLEFHAMYVTLRSKPPSAEVVAAFCLSTGSTRAGIVGR